MRKASDINLWCVHAYAETMCIHTHLCVQIHIHEHIYTSHTKYELIKPSIELVIPAFGKQRQASLVYKANQDYVAKPWLKEQKKREGEKRHKLTQIKLK